MNEYVIEYKNNFSLKLMSLSGQLIKKQMNSI